MGNGARESLAELADMCREKGIAEIELDWWGEGIVVKRIVMGPAPVAVSAPDASPPMTAEEILRRGKRVRYQRLLGRAVADAELDALP